MPRLSLYVPCFLQGCDPLNSSIQVGLFSAIVTAFLVASLARLQPDETARTNDLLINLTEIILLASRTTFNSTGLPQAAPFVPDASDVRQNVFWSISLVLSVCAVQYLLGYLSIIECSRYQLLL
jgi:hypothetical protein